MQSLAKEKIVQQALGASASQKLISPSKVKSITDRKIEEKDELFKLPEIKEDLTVKDKLLDQEEAGGSSDNKHYLDIYSLDVNSTKFKELPANVRLDILTDIKETRKQSSWGRLHEMPVEGDQFSNFQMQRLLKRRQVQQSFENAGKEIGGKCFSLAELESLMSEDGIIETSEKHSRQIASDENSRVMFVKDISKAISLGKIEESIEKDEKISEDMGEEFDEDLQKAIQMSLQDPDVVEVGESSSPQKVGDLIDFKIKGPFFEAFIAGVDPNDIKLNPEQRQKFGATAKTDQVRAYMMENGGMNDDDINDLLQATQSQKDEKIRNAIADILDDYVLYGSPVTKKVQNDSDKKKDQKEEDVPEIGFMSDSDDSDLADELDRVEKSQVIESQKDLFSSQDTIDYTYESERNVEKSPDQKSQEDKIEIMDSDDDFVEDDERVINSNDQKSGEENFVLSEDSNDCQENVAEKIESDSVKSRKNQESSGEKTLETTESPTNIESDGKLEILEESVATNKSPERPATPEPNPINLENLSNLEKSPEKTYKVPDATSSSSKKRKLTDYLEVTPRKHPKPSPDPKPEEEPVPKMPSPFFVKRTPSSKKKEQLLQDVLEEVREKIRVSKSLFPESKESNVEDQIKETANVLKESKTEEELQQMAGKLMKETKDLEAERNKQDRMGMSITESMTRDCKALLKLFGIPYIDSPMEAEAQAAFLNHIGLTDGTITDDSDIWLFGGKTVYKNVFQQKKIVKEYQIERIQEMFSMDREKLIQLAILCGSDYTTGIQGIGAVTALEILAAFPKTEEKAGETNKYQSLLSSLRKFRDWFNAGKSVGPGGKTVLKNKLKNIELHEGFPNSEVARAYLEPVVDKSAEPFAWGLPDVASIYEFTRNNMGWTRSKTDEILEPVLKRLNDKKQASITDYFKKQSVMRQYDKSKLSARVQKAVNKMAGICDDLKKPEKPEKSRKKTKKIEEKPVEIVELSEESEDDTMSAIDRPSTSSGVFHDEPGPSGINEKSDKSEKAVKSKDKAEMSKKNEKIAKEKVEKPKRPPKKPKNVPMNFMDKIREADRPKRPKREKDPDEPIIKSPKLDSPLLATTPKEKVYRLPDSNPVIPQKEKDKVDQELKKQKAIELFKKSGKSLKKK